MANPKRFSTAPVTAPTAGEAIPTARVSSIRPDVAAPRRPDVQTPAAPETPAEPSGSAARIAYTWRLTLDEADQLGGLVRRLRRQLGRGRLDKAAVLLALVGLADEDADVEATVLERLRRQGA